MHGAHACLVPVNYNTANGFKQLAETKKAAWHTRACDYCHLLLLLQFIFSNLFRDEVEERNSHHRGAPVIDPSEVLIGVINVCLCWYTLFRMTMPGKTAADINTLKASPLGILSIICIILFISVTSLISIILTMFFIVGCWICSNLFFLIKIKVWRLIFDTEKVHSVKHCHIDVSSKVHSIKHCHIAATGQKEDIRHGYISRASRQIKAAPLLKLWWHIR